MPFVVMVSHGISCGYCELWQCFPLESALVETGTAQNDALAVVAALDVAMVGTVGMALIELVETNLHAVVAALDVAMVGTEVVGMVIELVEKNLHAVVVALIGTAVIVLVGIVALVGTALFVSMV